MGEPCWKHAVTHRGRIFTRKIVPADEEGQNGEQGDIPATTCSPVTACLFPGTTTPGRIREMGSGSGVVGRTHARPALLPRRFHMSRPPPSPSHTRCKTWRASRGRHSFSSLLPSPPLPVVFTCFRPPSSTTPSNPSAPHLYRLPRRLSLHVTSIAPRPDPGIHRVQHAELSIASSASASGAAGL